MLWGRYLIASEFHFFCKEYATSPLIRQHADHQKAIVFLLPEFVY